MNVLFKSLHNRHKGKRGVILSCGPSILKYHKEINSIKDLIQLTEDYPLTSNVVYNIDLVKIHKIKDLLIGITNSLYCLGKKLTWIQLIGL